MKTVKHLSIVLAGLFLFIACQKEFSTESGYAGLVSTGSLLDTAGDCKNISVKGFYVTDSVLTDSNYVSVQVNFATGGSYKIITDSVNGFSFFDSGYTAPGLRTIKLKAKGRPIQATQTTFQVAYDTSFCTFSVNVIGNVPAAFTLVGTSTSCLNSKVNGQYVTGVALNGTNSVALQVSVTTPGSYAITTATVGGMTFSGSGNLTSTGLQTITLQASGTPTTAGSNVFPVTAGSSSCSFTVNVGTPSPNDTDTAWQFTQGSNSFHGPFYDVFDTTLSGAYGLVLLGYTPATGDTSMQLTILFSGQSIQPGTYNTKPVTNAPPLGAFYFTNYADTANPVHIYTADPTITTANTQITISSYDTATKTVTGTFSGTASNVSNVPVPITGGRFKARVR